MTAARLLAQAAVLDGNGPGSAAEALERRVAAPATREALAARIAVSTAYELDDQPASTLGDGVAGFGTFASHGVAGGNDLLARELARRLGARVRLGAPVERVTWGESGVAVRARGTELAAAACVVATPAPHTLEIVFDPPLPDWKRNALAAVRYGQAAKLFLLLAGSAPPSATLSVPDRYWTWTQHAPDGSPLPAACSFAGTAAALQRLDVAHGPGTWAAAVRRLRPDLPLSTEAPVLATWHDDPWAGGAYSARSLASPLDDDALARPAGRLLFAGEHTAGALHGLMEGALRSGVRAAADALAAI